VQHANKDIYLSLLTIIKANVNNLCINLACLYSILFRVWQITVEFKHYKTLFLFLVKNHYPELRPWLQIITTRA